MHLPTLKPLLVLGVLLLGLAATRCQAQEPLSPAAADKLARSAAEALDKRPDEASSLYRQVLAIRPNWAEGWLYLGASLYQQGRHAEASDAFRKGVALAPGQGTGWAFLGLCESHLDNAEQALADIRRGEELGIGGNPQFELAVPCHCGAASRGVLDIRRGPCTIAAARQTEHLLSGSH